MRIRFHVFLPISKGMTFLRYLFGTTFQIYLCLADNSLSAFRSLQYSRTLLDHGVLNNQNLVLAAFKTPSDPRAFNEPNFFHNAKFRLPRRYTAKSSSRDCDPQDRQRSTEPLTCFPRRQRTETEHNEVTIVRRVHEKNATWLVCQRYMETSYLTSLRRFPCRDPRTRKTWSRDRNRRRTANSLGIWMSLCLSEVMTRSQSRWVTE